MTGFVKVGFPKVVQQIREEFEDKPGLRVNVLEASRFWGLDERTCRSVLNELAASGFLAQGADRRFQMYIEA
jgi:Fic family protein